MKVGDKCRSGRHIIRAEGDIFYSTRGKGQCNQCLHEREAAWNAERRVRYAAKKWGKKLPVCEGVTAMGERCRLEARRESKFCRLHGDKSGGAE